MLHRAGLGLHEGVEKRGFGEMNIWEVCVQGLSPEQDKCDSVVGRGLDRG